MNEKIITGLGFSLSTTALGVVGRTADGQEVFVSLPMRGATLWNGQPAFDLSALPGLFMEALENIRAQGFVFAQGGVFSSSVRQHDMVVLGSGAELLIPALSWQCDAAAAEVEILRDYDAEEMVGRLEPRLILPKLLWALDREPGLAKRIRTVMTTGDFIAMQLTGRQTLCSSEALSNGLLIQDSREFAKRFIGSISGLSPFWFPEVVQSGRMIHPMAGFNYRTPDWDPVRELLSDWRAVASLGDNHGGAVGSGLNDRHTMVISSGTSGTVVRAVERDSTITGSAMRFEFYEGTLLLVMMADCGSWYSRFVKQFGLGCGHAELNSLASDEARAFSIPYPETPETPFPDEFCRLPLGVQVCTMQRSIAHCLSGYFKQLWEAEASGEIQRVIFTGGLTGSEYYCRMLKAWIRDVGFDGLVLVSSRTGPLANQAATLGALINALVGGGVFESREEAIKALCPTRRI